MKFAQILKYLFILIILFYLSVPKEALSNSSKDGKMPTWIKVTLFTSVTLSFGKWCWDTFLSEKRTDVKYSEADSSTYAFAYLLAGDSLKTFMELKSEEDRHKFINSYWKQFDPYPFDNKNEMRTEFEGRINEANFKYSTNSKKGWRTDKGRIYLLYGRPDEIKTLPFVTSIFQYPHSGEYTDLEIWLFDRTGGIANIPFEIEQYTNGRMFFLFARISGKGNHNQVYSSELGEMNEIGLIQKNPGSR